MVLSLKCALDIFCLSSSSSFRHSCPVPYRTRALLEIGARPSPHTCGITHLVLEAGLTLYCAQCLQPGSRLFISNLSYNTTWQQLKDHFKNIGNVVYCTIFKVRSGWSLPLSLLSDPPTLLSRSWLSPSLSHLMVSQGGVPRSLQRKPCQVDKHPLGGRSHSLGPEQAGHGACRARNIVW